MQIWLLKQRFITYCQALKFAFNNNDDCDGVLLDRSIFADSVFAEKNFIDGNFSREGYDCYLELRKLLLEKLPLPDVIVYLNASAKTCADRVNSRARDCESGIPLDYLEGLNSCYQNFVRDFAQRGAGVLNLPWENFGKVHDIMDQVNGLLNESIANRTRNTQNQELYTFVNDKAAVVRLRDSTVMVAEALGPEGVMDPVPWHAESVVTPVPKVRKQIVLSSGVAMPSPSSSDSSSPAFSEFGVSQLDTPGGQVPMATPDSSSPEDLGDCKESSSGSSSSNKLWAEEQLEGQKLNF